ncbi:MAG: PIN domain-containing protein [Chloroflexota bacterium]
MTGPGIESRIPAGARLVLDTSVLVAHITGTEVVSPVATRIVDGFITHGRNTAVASALSVGEALVRPAQAGLAREVGLGLLDIPGVQVRSVDFLVAAEAARIRAATALRMPDSVVIATGVLTTSHILVTNDRRLAAAVPDVVPGMQVVLLSDLV